MLGRVFSFTPSPPDPPSAGRLAPLGSLTSGPLAPTLLVEGRDDEHEGTISSIPRPQEVAMSTTVNLDTTCDYGGHDDVSRRGANPTGLLA